MAHWGVGAVASKTKQNKAVFLLWTQMKSSSIFCVFVRFG